MHPVEPSILPNAGPSPSKRWLTLRRAVAALGWLAAVGLPACAASLAGADLDRAAREATTVARASEVLDEAERQLDLALAHGRVVKGDDDGAPAPGHGAPAQRPPPAPPPALAEPVAGQAATGRARAAEVADRRTERPADRCSRACRALGSMKRAAERLCSLTGPSDGRCAAAERRVRAAERLVHRLCPRCRAP